MSSVGWPVVRFCNSALVARMIRQGESSPQSEAGCRMLASFDSRQEFHLAYLAEVQLKNVTARWLG